MMQTTANNNILALDVGERRVGVAIANTIARLPRPLTTLIHDENLLSELEKLIDTEHVTAFVIGLPRDMNGQETAQTKFVRAFVERLNERIGVPVYLQDEALTSHQAEQELSRRGTTHDKGAIDALAAVYILEDFLRDNTGGNT